MKKDFLHAAAARVGFDACGVAAAAFMPHFARQLGAWLAAGCHASMQYMEENVAKRVDPTLLVPGAKSVVSVAVGYNPSQVMAGDGRVARFAYGEDYHAKLKRMLYALMEELRREYPGFEGRAFVDTAPISDKLWAAAAGLGWIGRNTLLLTPRYGSWVNLGEIVTTATFDRYDVPLQNRCGTCRRCVDACPNGALKDNGEGGYCLQAQRCAAYNTIENRGETLPEDVKLSGYLFGCDICQLACPYNAEAPTPSYIPPERMEELYALKSCDKHQFKKIVKNSTMSRMRFEQLQRNRGRNH